MLPDRSGIGCDLCGTKYRSQFKYYSIELRSARSQQGRPLPLSSVRRLPIEFEFDMCAACYAVMTRAVVAAYRSVSVGAVCELTGQELHGDFAYCYVDITGVGVSSSPSGKLNTTATPRELELTISESEYSGWRDRVSACRKAASEWQTQST